MSAESSKKTRCSRINAAQTKEMVRYMCEHPKFARGAQMGYDGTRTREEMWEELAGILNKLGGRKEVEQWQVSWRDIKSKATAKAAGNRKDRAATGNKEITTIPLTELEQKVVAIYGKEYSEGSAVLDTLVEENELQQRLVNGEVILVELDSEQLENMDDQSTICTLDNQIEGADWVDQDQDQEEPKPTTSGTSTFLRRQQQQTASQTKTQRKPKNPKNPSKERIGVQLEVARKNFQELCGNQTAAMQLLAEAAMKQAEAAQMQAEAAQKQGDAALLQAANEQRRIELQAQNDERLMTAYGKMTDVMTLLLDKLNQL
ncbi:uncharacterized protein LOC117649705 [Thrips palmi]|uniref:Regulatory protein zeste n=1 Tax=Thrips palmi TaxID=161013 RepID=A0A6P8ZTI7_THRPL|nr:uncharacterized protein LOC117649705 [Thrips palmi]